MTTSTAVFSCRVFAEKLDVLPECIKVSIKTGDKIYTNDISCEYATIKGKMIDFSGKPFPAALVLNRKEFEGMETGFGTWSDLSGNYSVVVPKGIYNAFFIDDNTYGKTSLEGWCWNMIVDQNEQHDFKIGNGEVYSLCAWANDGGSPMLNINFRPMVLPPDMKPKQYQTEINGRKFDVIDYCPELKLEDIAVTINGFNLKVISLQKIYETSDQFTAPSYILQTERIPQVSGYSTAGKQTLIIEYDSEDKNGYISQSQGRTQFFYRDTNALSIKC